ncbi:hypothetical protein PJ267_08320 [Arthrobacter sp. OVS8]|nr:hypothetical protein PJ267_08320 [Arthrobacter sp. OVS8]
MTAEKDLHTLLATMHPELREGEFVYVLWPHGRPSPVRSLPPSVRQRA